MVTLAAITASPDSNWQVLGVGHHGGVIIRTREHDTKARPDRNWTIDDAAAQLHPELTAAQVRALIDLFGIEPNGRRYTGRRGKPLPTYDPATIQQAHAVVWRARVDLGLFRAA